MRFAVSFLVLTLLNACGHSSVDSFPKSTVTDGGQAQNSVHRPNLSKIDPFQSLSYEFQDTVASCSTGLKKFNSMHELCMNILDSDFNQGCADQPRYASFFRFCGPKGYLPTDGLQCKVGLLKTSVADTARSGRADVCYGQFSKADFIESQEVCIGRKVGANDETTFPIQENVFLASDLSVQINAAYTLPTQQSETQYTHFKSRLISPNKASSEKEFTAGMTTKVGCTTDTIGQYRVFTACKPVIGCR